MLQFRQLRMFHPRSSCVTRGLVCLILSLTLMAVIRRVNNPKEPEATAMKHEEGKTAPEHKRLLQDGFVCDDDSREDVFSPVSSELKELDDSSPVLQCQTGLTLRQPKQVSKQQLQLPNSSSLQGEEAQSRRDSFTHIYKTAHSTGGRRGPNISVSGPGSTMKMTASVRKTIESVIEMVKRVTNKTYVTLLDIPCGDFFWMRHVVQNRTDIIYTGMDIVPELIENLRSTYSHYKHIRFVNHDVVAAPLHGAYDVIFSREMTQHLASLDTLKVLLHFSESESKYLLMTTYPDILNSQYRLKSGQYRAENLEMPPYALEAPMCMEKDGTKGYIALWRLPLTQVSNCTVSSDKHFQHEAGYLSCS